VYCFLSSSVHIVFFLLFMLPSATIKGIDFMLQEMVSLNIDGHQIQLMSTAQQNVLNVDQSQSDFIQLPYASTELFQQQGSVPTVSS